MDMEMDLDLDQGSHAAAATSSASNQQQQPQAKQESLPSISNLFQLVNQNDQSSTSASPSDSNLRGPFHRSESHLPPMVGSGAGLPLPPFSREKLPIPSSESPLRLPSSPAFLLQRSLSSSSPTANPPSPRDSLRSLDDVASSLPSAFGPMRGSGPTRNLYASSNSSSPSPGSHYSDLPLGAPSPSPSISSAASSIMSPRTTPKPQRLALGPSATTAFSIEDEMEYEKEVETERSSLEMSNPPHPAFKFPSRPASLSAARSFSSNGVDLSSNHIHRSSNPNSMLPPPTTNVGSRSAGLKPEASWTKHSRAGTEEGSQSHHSIATSSHSSSSSSSSHGKRRAEDEDQTFQDRLQKAPSTRRRHTLGAADAPDRSATSSRMSNLNPRSSLGADLAQAYSQFIPSQAAPPVPTLPSLRDSPRFFGVATSHSSPAIPTVASHHHHHHHHPYQIPATSHARNPSAQSKQSSSGTDSYSSSRDSYHSYSSSRDSSYFGSNRNSNSHLSIRSGLPLPDSGRGGLPDSPTTPTGPNPNAGQETQFARHSQYSSSSSQEFVPRHSNRASNSTFASSTSSLPLTHSTRGSLPSLSSCASGSASASSLSLSVESRSSHSRNSTADSLHSNAWNRGAVGSHPPFLHHSVESELRDVNEREKTETHAFDSSYHPPQGLSSSGKPKGRKSKTKKKPSLPPRSSSLKLRQDAKDWESRDGSAGVDYETEGTYHDDSPETNSEKSILSGNGSGSGGSSNGGITPSQSQQVWSNESSWSSESVIRANPNLPGRERNVSDGSGSGSSNGSFSRQSRISGMRSTQSSGPLASPGPGFFLPQRVSSMDLDEAYRRGPPDSSNQSHLRSSSQSSTNPALQTSSGMLSSSPSSSMSFRYNLPQADFKTNRRISGGSIASNFSGSSSGASSFHSLPLAHNQSTDSIGSFRVKDEGNELDPSPSFDDTGVDHQMSSVPSDTSPSGKKNQSTGSTSTSASTSTSGSGKYECEHCKKRFTRPSSLKIHIYTHTGERPFVCPDPSCGRSFSVQSNLRRHQKAHATWKERAADTIPEGVKVDTVTRSNSSRSKNFDSSFDRSYSSDSRHQARESSPPTSPPSNFGSSPIASEAFDHQQANEFDGRTAVQREGSLCPTRPSRATSTSSNLSIRERFEGMMGAD